MMATLSRRRGVVLSPKWRVGFFRSTVPFVALAALSLSGIVPFARASSSCAIEPNASVDLVKFRGLAGSPSILPDSLQGRVVLLVNTASYCGYTKQLTSLETLHQRYKARGLTVIGIPCNDFGGQEPDSEEKIAAFYAKDHGVTFPLTAKYSVAGGDSHPFYLHMAHKLGDAGVPPWNFHKYLLGRKGDIVGLFDPSIDPLDAQIIQTIEKELEEQVPVANRGGNKVDL